jgi:hypothetical protein
MRFRTLSAALVAAACLDIGMSLTTANASELSLDGPQVYAETIHGCTSDQIVVTQTPENLGGWIFGYRGVQLTVPASCAGSDLDLTIYRTSGGSAVATIHVDDVPAGSLSRSFSGGAINGLFGTPASVALTFDGWAVPATF